ncbi:MAG TPA: hypothetical protein VG500_11925 [Gemmatimonadales bacterium]|nr:hypothetical protein [Gemmatimonadales bacterium]
MNDFEAMDLSPLDPARDPARWSGLLEATRLRIEAVLAGRLVPVRPLDVVHAWSRVLLPAAAVFAVVLGAAGAVVGGRDPALDRASEARRLAVLSDHSIGRGQRPTGAELLVAIRSRRAP